MKGFDFCQYVDRVLRNGEDIPSYKNSAEELMQGGILQFYMK